MQQYGCRELTLIPAKQMMDMEGVHTYEGTYEINSLVAAREITGKAAFK